MAKRKTEEPAKAAKRRTEVVKEGGNRVWKDLDGISFAPSEANDIILTCGDPSMGQLGHGEDMPKSLKPRKVDMPAGMQFFQVAAGAMHTAVLTANGDVLTTGLNDDGALGRPVEDADSGMSFTLKTVTLPAGCGRPVMISAGDCHTAALTANGAVVAWGTFRDKEKPMGLTREAVAADEKFTRPIVIYNPDKKDGQIDPKTKIVKISSGCNHILLLRGDGQVMTVGSGDSGQLGRVPARTTRHSGILCRLQPQVVVQMHHKCDNVWATAYGCLAKRFSNDEIYVWGQNNWGQLGIHLDVGTDVYWPMVSTVFLPEKKWQKITGEHHLLALAGDGSVWGIGRGDDWRFGLNDDVDNKRDLVAIPIPLPPQAKVIDISANLATSAAATDVGVFVWGFNTNGELGLGAESEGKKVPQPTKVESKHLEGYKVVNVSLGAQHMVLMGRRPSRK